MQTCHIFKKSDGAIRPVGIREALRRIMVKAVSWVFKKDIVEWVHSRRVQVWSLASRRLYTL